ncbi:MAG TPA: galactose-1-phosphate uridylyltransferase [Actinocrinis sp.]|uniref:galactose-1-phosphate uridylyltransferase n=1 Tax=Actinocrinis sp. TaxID=1920516 RepID=UPI002DDD6400|nr:galactose-1-phosphate uridylyltransferase [Actinocrinis sp.]HEV3171108.1 galactose-1-phosphate uridylyltransferase [Actinocrinis sp.]
MRRRPAVFLDRDGTLTEPRHYPSLPEHLVLSPGVGPPLRCLQERGIALVVVTNQSGLARGLFDADVLESMHAHLRSQLAAEGVTLDAVLHCPHHVDGVVPHLAVACECRKPKPGLLLKAARDLGLDLSSSWMVGDFASDVEAGRRAGCRTARITRGDAVVMESEPADIRASSAGEALHAIWRSLMASGVMDGSMRVRTADGSAQLADGRCISFYNDGPAPPRVVQDRRELPSRPAPGRLRWDPLEEDWVISAPYRAARTSAAETVCPLCPSRGGLTTEIPVEDYDVAVIDNRYPALNGGDVVLGRGSPLVDAPASGACEVVSFGSDHHIPLSRHPVDRVRTVITAWADRTRVLGTRPEVCQVVCFENRGAQIGASLDHPHGQIYAYPFLPARLARIQACAERTHERGDGCEACNLIERESAARERVVVEAERWTAFVPYAARWPYEIFVYPRRHVPDLPALTAAEVTELAGVYRSVIGCFDRVAATPLPYMALWVQAPARSGREHSHLHARVFTDRCSETVVKKPAAGELGAGAFVSETEPERAAALLRAALTTEEVACG